MKRVYLPLLLCLSLCLSGCGKNTAREKTALFMQSISQQPHLLFTAQLRCEYTDRSLDFTLQCESDMEGCQVTVIAPELIRGIRARVETDAGSLIYDDVTLDTGPLDDFGLSPMSALPLLLEAMKTAYVDSCWEEAGEYAAMLIPSDHMSIQLNLDKYTLCPVYAELISDGRVTVFVRFLDWTQERMEHDERSAKENLGGDKP